MGESARYEEISPWVEAPTDRQAPLEGDLRADVVVVGGGYTGLSSAIALRAEGADVAVLERDFAGSGASGRNAGHLTPTIGKDLPTLLRVYGREKAGALVRFADRAVEYTEQLIEKQGIDCEYAPTGNVLAGLHPKHEARLRRAAEAAATLGGELRFLSPGEMRERGMPAAFRSGVLESRGGHLHPGRLVMGMRRAAISAGARLFEDTRVVGIEDGAPLTVRVERGSVRADCAVLATNAYTPELGWKPRRVAPLRVSLFESAALSEADLASLGWAGREGIYTAHEILESYRLTARRTIVGGSKLVRYAYGSRLAPGRDPEAFRLIEGAFRERFPTLRDVPVARFWGGWIGLTADFLPILGTAGAHGSLHLGVGFCGHGVAQATLLGEMLAMRIQGRAHSCEAALARRGFDWPPEPLRFLAAKLLQAGLSALDARTDRQIRKLRA